MSTILVMKVRHIPCGQSYYELMDDEVIRCPWCKNMAHDGNVEVQDEVDAEIKLDPLTGKIETTNLEALYTI